MWYCPIRLSSIYKFPFVHVNTLLFEWIFAFLYSLCSVLSGGDGIQIQIMTFLDHMAHYCNCWQRTEHLTGAARVSQDMRVMLLKPLISLETNVLWLIRDVQGNFIILYIKKKLNILSPYRKGRYHSSEIMEIVIKNKADSYL